MERQLLRAMRRHHHYLRRTTHDDDPDNDDPDNDDCGNDCNQAIRTPGKDPTGEELAWNVALSVLVVAFALGFLAWHGVDRPVRADGVSPGCGLACCAAGGCCPTEGGRCYRQSLLASLLSFGVLL